MVSEKVTTNSVYAFRYLTVLLLLFSIPVMLFANASAHAAGQPTLAWNAVNSPTPAGYKLYYGTVSGSYAYSVNVGNTTTYTMSGLSTGATYYFAVTDYNSGGLESGYSNEVSYTVPSGCTYSISPTGVSVSASGATGSIGVTTQSGCAWTASSAASWMSITSGSSGTGNGTVNYAVAANTGTSSRSAASTVAGFSFTVTQAAAAQAPSRTYIITASAGRGGTISPSGSVSVNSGTSKSFLVTAAKGYAVSNVTVDGKSRGALSSYTFSNVTASHTIKATFSYRWRW